MKYFAPLQAIKIKVRPVGNCCQQAIFKPDNAASKCNLSVKGLEDLINGIAPNELASLLGTATSVVQEFINGKANPGMANVIGSNVTTTQELRNRIDRNGAIGLLIGICLEKARSK